MSENRQSEDNRTVLVTVDPKQIKEGKVGFCFRMLAV